MLTVGGFNTVIVTGAEVVDKPEPVATAVNVYDAAAKPVAVKLNGELVAEPAETPLVKNCTFVTVPPTCAAETWICTLAGAAKTEPLTGLVMEQVGRLVVGATAGVDRV
jgi:hypothetical protein